MILGRGFLRKEYYQTWADYFIRFLDEYSSQGLEMWGLTAQNEPADGRIPDFFFNSMGWTAAERAGANQTLRVAMRGFPAPRRSFQTSRKRAQTKTCFMI